LFAFTDEVQQAFIVDQDERMMDILLDVASGVTVLILISILKKVEWTPILKQKR
jgi:hypothetical protein